MGVSRALRKVTHDGSIAQGLVRGSIGRTCDLVTLLYPPLCDLLVIWNFADKGQGGIWPSTRALQMFLSAVWRCHPSHSWQGWRVSSECNRTVDWGSSLPSPWWTVICEDHFFPDAALLGLLSSHPIRQKGFWPIQCTKERDRDLICIFLWPAFALCLH